MQVKNSVHINITGSGPSVSENVRHFVASISQAHSYSINRVVMSSSGESATIVLVSEYDDGKDSPDKTAYEARTEAPKDDGGDRTEKPREGIKAEDASKPAEEPECDCPACQFRAVLSRALGIDKAEEVAGIRLVRIPLG